MAGQREQSMTSRISASFPLTVSRGAAVYRPWVIERDLPITLLSLLMRCAGSRSSNQAAGPARFAYHPVT